MGGYIRGTHTHTHYYFKIKMPQQRVHSMYQLKTSQWKLDALPEDVFKKRLQEASAFVRNTIQDEDVKLEYGRHLKIIHYNKIKVLEGIRKRPLQHVYNFGLSLPSANDVEVRQAIVSDFQQYVLPKVDNVTKVCVMLGTMMQRIHEDGGEPVNVKFFRPDFNSQVNLLTIKSKATALQDLIDGLGSGNSVLQ